jgi:hypothetical protein
VTAVGLSDAQAEALVLLLEAEVSCGGPEAGYAMCVGNGPTRLFPGPFAQVELNARTARSLWLLDLIDVESYDYFWDDVRLSDFGRVVALLAGPGW